MHMAWCAESKACLVMPLQYTLQSADCARVGAQGGGGKNMLVLNVNLLIRNVTLLSSDACTPYTRLTATVDCRQQLIALE